MTPYNRCKVLQSKYSQWPYGKKITNKRSQILLLKEQGHKVHNRIINLCQSRMWCLTININNVHLKKILTGWKTRAEIDIDYTIDSDVKSYKFNKKK